LPWCPRHAFGKESDTQTKVERLEQEVAELKAAIEELRALGIAEQRLDEIERKIEILAAEVEDLKVGEAAVTASREAALPGLGPAASKVYQKESGVSIGGYGEALYESFADERDDCSTPRSISSRPPRPRVDRRRSSSHTWTTCIGAGSTPGPVWC
jgi:hypothetical protein